MLHNIDATQKGNGMQLKTILNRVQKYPAFVYDAVRLLEHPHPPHLTLEVRVRPPRRDPYPVLAVPGAQRPATTPCRHAASTSCPSGRSPSSSATPCAASTARAAASRSRDVPWASGKHRLTDACAWFLAGWAKRLSWQEVADAFPTSWDTVYRAVRTAVDWGLAHRDLANIEAIGVDELSRRRGQRYLTLVYQIDDHRRRLLWVGSERRAATLHGFFDWFGPARSAALRFVCSDMWKAYLTVIAERAGHAVHVLDRFHIMAHLSQAIDAVRAAEARKLAAKGKAPVLKRSRWLLLK